MGILSRLREAGSGFIARHAPGDSLELSAQIPGSRGPLWQIKVNVDSSPQAGGKLLRVRAHWRLSLWRRVLSSWIEVRASDAALDEGSRALVPERLAELGVEARPDQPVQSWAGELGGARPGYGVLSLLRLDKARLPQWLRHRLGSKPFQLAATLATAVEESPTAR